MNSKVVSGNTNLSLDDIEQILDDNLREEDVEILSTIRRKFSNDVLWRKLTSDIFRELEIVVQDVVESGSSTRSKRSLVELLSEEEIAYYWEDSQCLRRQYVELLLIKKLLGSIKTAVNKELGKISMLTSEEEAELTKRGFEIACQADEEEMDLVEEERTSHLHLPSENSLKFQCTFCGEIWDGELPAQGFRCDCGVWLSSENTGDVIDAEIQILSQEEGEKKQEDICKGKHTSTFVRIRLTPHGGKVSEEYCVRCRKVIKLSKVKKWKVEKGECAHSHACWKEGEAGVTALCVSCKEPMKNPGSIDWASAGLEPYGDDPSQDEIIYLGVGAEVS